MTLYRNPTSRSTELFKPLRTKLVFTETVLLNSSSSVPFVTHTFRANSLYDPDFTGVLGHQPYRFDQLAAIYGRYEVLSSKCRVQFATGEKTLTTTTTGPWHVGVVCSSQATPAGTGTDPGYTLAEAPRADHGALCADMVKQCNTYWDRSLNGVVKHDDSLTAAVTGNPGSEGYYIIWMFNEGETIVTNVLAHVRIEFDVQFTRPLQVAVS